MPDQHEAGRPRSALGGQSAPEIEQQQVVFARLDRADADEIGRLRQRRAVRRDLRRIDAEWRDQHGGGMAAAVEVRLESVAGRGRADNHSVGQQSRGLDPPAVPQILAGSSVFGKLDRDQIVYQANKARAASSLEPADQPAPLEMVVRHQ